MKTVSTRIEPTLLKRFADLNFKPAQALAEYIDNAIQSWEDNQHHPLFADKHYRFRVWISIEWCDSTEHRTYAKKITIEDNAGGITENKFEKAFMTAHKPTVDTGMNEYGMGMKTASCWFCKKWTLTSKAIGENIERSTTYDVDRIIQSGIEEIEVEERKVQSTKPFTRVELVDLIEKNNITKRTLNKIKETLASIYRKILTSKKMELYVDGDKLSFEQPEFLTAPYYKDYKGEEVTWCKDVSFKMGKKTVKGFIGLLKEQSDKNNRLVIIRRGRVVVGEDSEQRLYIKSLQGQKGSPRDKRVFGELQVSGFNATFNKNGISESEELTLIIDRIVQEQLIVNGHKMLLQAQNYKKSDHKASKEHSSNATTTETTSSAGTSTETTKTGTSSRTTNTGTTSSGGHTPVPTSPVYVDGYQITSKTFLYEATTYTMTLVIDHSISDMIYIKEPDTSGRIKCLFNNKKCPLEVPDRIPKEIGKLLCSLAIATFLTKQRNGKCQDLLDMFNAQVLKFM